jgi:HD-GYP domain-containing protein (c-di-GMP phosphodiesterase class II)
MTLTRDNMELQQFLTQLNAVVINMHLYAAEHPQAEKYLSNAFNNLEGLLRNNPEITLMLIGQDLVVNNTPLSIERLNLSSFHRLLKERGIERLTFLPGVTANEFQDCIRSLASQRNVAVRSSRCVKIGKVELKVKQDGLSDDAGDDEKGSDIIQPIREVRDGKYEEIKTLYHNAQRHQKIDVRGVDDMIKAFIQGFTLGINPLGLMASLKSSDEYTFTHVVNVCILTMGQAEALGFSGSQLYKIGVASMLHDVGKLFIPDEIINKPGKLTDEERKIIETHTIQGGRYLLRVDKIPKLAVLGAIEHHIKYDGSGYPFFKGGWKPNIVSQMIAIADVFDALRSRRVYSDPKTPEFIQKILNSEKGSTFNPFLVNNFLKIIGRKGG